MNHETKEVLFKKKFLALDMYAHRALKLVEIGIQGPKVKEALQQAQKCLHACREAIDEGN
jgi:hypothetical protein